MTLRACGLSDALLHDNQLSLGEPVFLKERQRRSRWLSGEYYGLLFGIQVYDVVLS